MPDVYFKPKLVALVLIVRKLWQKRQLSPELKSAKNNNNCFIPIFACCSSFQQIFLLDKATVPFLDIKWSIFNSPQDENSNLSFFAFLKAQFKAKLSTYQNAFLTKPQFSLKPAWVKGSLFQLLLSILRQYFSWKANVSEYSFIKDHAQLSIFCSLRAITLNFWAVRADHPVWVS